jgi:hypothetical protein
MNRAACRETGGTPWVGTVSTGRRREPATEGTPWEGSRGGAALQETFRCAKPRQARKTAQEPQPARTVAIFRSLMPGHHGAKLAIRVRLLGSRGARLFRLLAGNVERLACRPGESWEHAKGRAWSIPSQVSDKHWGVAGRLADSAQAQHRKYEKRSRSGIGQAHTAGVPGLSSWIAGAS